MQDNIIINDYIQGDPLSDGNIDKTFDYVNKTHLSLPTKTIWLYSGYTWEQIFTDGVFLTKDCAGWKRREIVKQCNVLVDGRYVDSERDISLKWRGSKNQRVIDVDKSLQQNRIVLYCD